MVGRDVALAMDYVADERAAPRRARGSPADARRCSRCAISSSPTRAALTAVDDVSFSVAPGEILGIAGVEGNGQTELIEAIAGLRAPRGGSIALAGRDVTELLACKRPRRRRALAHPRRPPRARPVLDYSIAENLILGQQHRFTSGVRARSASAIAENAREQIAAFDIRPRRSRRSPARALSGGNQQKIVIAREMGARLQVLLAAQPTRGVDVGAIEFIHARLREARDAGKGDSARLGRPRRGARALRPHRGDVRRTDRRGACRERRRAQQVLGPYMTGASGDAA